MFSHVYSQFCQRGKGPVTPRAGVWTLFLELFVSKAVVFIVLFMLKTFQAAGALVGPFVDMSAQVVLKCIHFDEDCVAMWTPVLSLLVNSHMPLVVRLFLEKLVTLSTIIETICMSFLVLLQGSFQLKLLPTYRTCPIMYLIHMCGEIFGTGKGFRAQGTNALLFLLVLPHVPLQILWEGKSLRAPATRVILSVCCFAMTENVSSQVSPSLENSATV